MNARLPKYVPAFLVLAVLTSACGSENTLSPTEPAEPPALLRAEPDSVVPEFSTISFCRPQRSFGLRFIVIVRPVSDLFLRGVRVVFVDRFGRRAFPTAGVFTTGSGLPSNAGPITFPSTSPIPIPTTPASTIPIPGPSGFDPLLIHGGRSQSLPIFLEFGCGIPSSGTVFVNVETSDRNGRSRHSELRVAVQD